jgi:transcriptional regulator with XRE-family HTH domain
VLRAARESAELSLTEVAELSGLNRQAISLIEQGGRRPTAETFVRLVIALNMRPSEAWAQAEQVIFRDAENSLLSGQGVRRLYGDGPAMNSATSEGRASFQPHQSVPFCSSD